MGYSAVQGVGAEAVLVDLDRIDLQFRDKREEKIRP
jgi:hypothetical protein